VPARYSVHAIAKGYVWTRLHGVLLAQGSVEVRLERGGEAHIGVNDSASQPIRNAEFEISIPAPVPVGPTSSWQVEVGSDPSSVAGLYRMSGIGREGAKAIVHAPAYGAVVLDIPPLPADGVISLSVVLPKESGITGRVEDERGKPVAAADIQVVPTMSEGGRSGRTSSSADGLFKLSDVPAGKYKLWVTTADYMDSETLELTVFEESKSSVLVQLIRTGTIGGQVLGAVSRESLRRLRVYGTPVGGAASVMPDERSAPSGYSAVLRSDRTVRAFTVPIGESGTFEVTGVAPGDYYMCVSGDSGGSAAGTIKRRVLVSVLGGEKIDVALPIPILGTIYGFVSTASEYAATDTPVVLCKRTANGWGEQLRASVDAAGAYAFDLLEPQAYVVALLPRSGVGVMLSREILIRGGESVRHDFGQADGTIAGHVEGCASGALIGDVVVRARLKGKGGSNEPLDVTAAILQVLAAELGRTELAFRRFSCGPGHDGDGGCEVLGNAA
jgi:hypothetical protein